MQEWLLFGLLIVIAIWAQSAHALARDAARKLEEMRDTLKEIKKRLEEGQTSEEEEDGIYGRFLWRARRGTERAVALHVVREGRVPKIVVQRSDAVFRNHYLTDPEKDPGAIERESAWLGKQLSGVGWVPSQTSIEWDERHAFDKEWDKLTAEWKTAVPNNGSEGQ